MLDHLGHFVLVFVCLFVLFVCLSYKYLQIQYPEKENILSFLKNTDVVDGASYHQKGQ